MNGSKRVAIAALLVAALTGAGTAQAQLSDDSIGTAQVTPPPADVSVGPGGASVSVPPAPGGSQTATGSVGTVQVGGAETQQVTGSVGSVQAQVPGVTAGAGASPSADGAPVDPNASFSVGTSPAAGGPQGTSDSIGTAQVGGAGSQTVGDSIGTAQVAQPGVSAEGSFQGPLRPDMPDGRVVLPEADLVASVDPAESGPQTAAGSIGTAQVGGGSQTAGDSVGTAQVAVPAMDASAGAGGTDPTVAGASAAVTPTGGSQTADGSAGTLQIGGGGPQTATDSAGTGQVAVPILGADAALNRDDLTASTASVSATPTGGPQLADGSAATVQVGGGGSQTTSDSVGTGQVAVPAVSVDVEDGASVTLDPSGGSQTADNSVGTLQVGGGSAGGSFNSFDGSTSTADTTGAGTAVGDADELGKAVDPAAAADAVTVEQQGQPLGAGKNGPLQQTATLVGSLPFTGLALWTIALLGLVVLALGFGPRRSPRAAA